MQRSDRIALAAFTVGSVLAGGNAVGIRFSNRELTPLWGAGFRFALAALLLNALVVVLRLDLPRGSDLWGAVLYGLFNFAVSFSLAYYGLTQLHAGLGQTLLALAPLLTLLLSALIRAERLRAASVGGTLLATAGVALVSRASVGGSVSMLAVLALLASALSFSVAAVIVSRFTHVHPVALNAIALPVGAILLIAGAAVAGEPLRIPHRAATWLALSYLVGIVSGVSGLLYLIVLRHWSPSRAAYSFVVMPFVAVLLSSWLDSEPLSMSLVAGGLLILGGVYVGALRPGGRPVGIASIPPT